MVKQNDNPYYDLISLYEWTNDNDKKTILLSHFPHLASGKSIREIFDHFYKDAKEKELFLNKYFGSMGLKLTSPKDRMCDSVKQFVD